jgi:hypothetical protein
VAQALAASYLCKPPADNDQDPVISVPASQEPLPSAKGKLIEDDWDLVKSEREKRAVRAGNESKELSPRAVRARNESKE